MPAMKQADLNRAVASSLGETVSTIASRGFSLLTELYDEREPLVVDFDDMSYPVVLPIVEPAS
jgi:hypothetical protein